MRQVQHYLSEFKTGVNPNSKRKEKNTKSTSSHSQSNQSKDSNGRSFKCKKEKTVNPYRMTKHKSDKRIDIGMTEEFHAALVMCAQKEGYDTPGDYLLTLAVPDLKTKGYLT